MFEAAAIGVLCSILRQCGKEKRPVLGFTQFLRQFLIFCRIFLTDVLYCEIDRFCGM